MWAEFDKQSKDVLFVLADYYEELSRPHAADYLRKTAGQEPIDPQWCLEVTNADRLLAIYEQMDIKLKRLCACDFYLVVPRPPVGVGPGLVRGIRTTLLSAIRFELGLIEQEEYQPLAFDLFRLYSSFRTDLTTARGCEEFLWGCVRAAGAMTLMAKEKKANQLLDVRIAARNSIWTREAKIFKATEYFLFGRAVEMDEAVLEILREYSGASFV